VPSVPLLKLELEDEEEELVLEEGLNPRSVSLHLLSEATAVSMALYWAVSVAE